MSSVYRGSGGGQHIGRSRIRLAKLLCECLPDLDIKPEDIEPATGSNRTGHRSACYRWELYTRRKNTAKEVPVVLGCYDTIACCLKAGSVKESFGELYATPKETKNVRR